MQTYSTDIYSLYELLKREIELNGKFWNTKDKIDYIYIRMCQLFNYDERWSYSSNSKLREYIYEYNINVFRVDIRKLVCSSFSKAFCDLVNIFLADDENFDIALTEGNIEDGHMYSLVLLRDGTSYIYDPISNCNDFLNAKIGNKLQGIRAYNNLDDWENELRQDVTYRNIGYSNKYLSKINSLMDKYCCTNYFGIDLLDMLVNEVDICGLGLYEVNNLLNLYSNAFFEKNLNLMGISLKYDESEDESRFIYMVDGDFEYLEREVNGGVVFVKLKS